MFLEDMGMHEPGLDRVIRAAYQLLGLQTYFTAGPKEVRAWTVRAGATAPQAAGVIHTDFEKGFIRAETIAFDDYVRYKGEGGAKEAGRMRLEGTGLRRARRRRDALPLQRLIDMATIAQLFLYPVKGCRGIAVERAALVETGLEVDGIGDREWVVVDDDGEFLSQRELPKMALIETRLTAGTLRLKAPGMLQLEVPIESEGDVVKVRVWNDEIAAVTQGEIADAWFSRFLGRPGPAAAIRSGGAAPVERSLYRRG